MLTRRWRDFDAAEDAVQEALLAAAEQWPVQGVPDNPRGWLVTVATRRHVDAVRSEVARRAREEAVHVRDTGAEPAAGDDSLELLLLCCHPVLTPASAIALTLRCVGGLSTAAVAAAFLVPEVTMAQRISRAKQTLRDAGARFQDPGGSRAQVLHVLYLVFSEGHTTSGGADLLDADLSREAIRLTRMLRARVPGDPEVSGLLALMLLTEARAPARSAPDGTLVALDAQDRARWDAALVAEGTALVEATLPVGPVGPYQVQAAIAALHDEAPTAADTDWPQVLALYDVLIGLSDGPIVRLNRAVALSRVRGPAAGLAEVDALGADKRLRDHHRRHAVRAHLLEEAGDLAGAVEAYLAAAERTTKQPERTYLRLRAARLRT